MMVWSLDGQPLKTHFHGIYSEQRQNYHAEFLVSMYTGISGLG